MAILLALAVLVMAGYPMPVWGVSSPGCDGWAGAAALGVPDFFYPFDPTTDSWVMMKGGSEKHDPISISSMPCFGDDITSILVSICFWS